MKLFESDSGVLAAGKIILLALDAHFLISLTSHSSCPLLRYRISQPFPTALISPTGDHATAIWHFIPMAITDIVIPAFITLTGVIVQTAHNELQWPFIDEIFHLRQCAAYCAHHFNVWDNKITTPPGLYLIGTWYHHILKALGFSNSCGATALRSLNLVGGLIALPFILSMVPTNNYWKVNIVSLPLLYSYYFLFYTDVWSTVLVLLPLLAILKYPSIKGSLIANLAGFFGLWLRQTNIVWLMFVAVVLIDKRKARSNTFKQHIQNFITKCFRDWSLLTPFAVNGLLFASFIYYNGGITFGDKENHQVTLHIVQVFYCVTFISFFTLPVWFSPNKMKGYIQFAITGRKGLNILFTVASFAIIYHIVKNYTVVHPFLLADNRHYTFYIYRKILSKSWSQLAVLPVYHFGSWVLFHSLRTLYRSSMLSLHPISLAALLFCSSATLIPSPLFEPRYYIVPLVLVRMFMVPQNERLNRSASHLMEFIWYLAINTMYFIVFFSYTFSWLTEPGLQRIIW